LRILISLTLSLIVLSSFAATSAQPGSGGGFLNPQRSAKTKAKRRASPNRPKKWTAYPPLTEKDCFVCPVEVEVTIGENGNVISARAISGDLLLRQAAVFAAQQERFPPKGIAGQPVKYTEKISYKLVRQ
jgi:outer membrane biosynthesis protein TonB